MAKKRRAPSSNSAKRKQAAGKRRAQSKDMPPLPDRRLMERTMADVHALLEEQDFESVEQANAFLQEALARGPLPHETPQTELDRAQDLVYEALEASGRKRVRLAREALAVSADCADAYVLLAEEQAKTVDEALELYRQGVAAAERALGPEAFEELKGTFWGFVETRPYMRARAGLATCLWAMGQREEAVGHLQALLDLNPNDNQGVRCMLAMWLLGIRRLPELEALLKRFPDDGMLEMVWAEAVCTFLTRGKGAAARRAFRAAMERNPHVMKIALLGERPAPRSDGYVTMGGEHEADSFWMAFMDAVGDDDEIARWFVGEAEDMLAGVALPTKRDRPGRFP